MVERPTPRPRRRWLTISMRMMLAIVLACGLAMGGLLLWIETYRRDWQAELQALAEIRAEGRTVNVTTQPVGPDWLRKLSGPRRAKHFERVTAMYIANSSPLLSDQQRATFKNLRTSIEIGPTLP